MKVNDYVKFENEIVKVSYVRQLGDDIYYDLSNGLYYCGEDLPLATSEETLEMFEGRFANCYPSYILDNQINEYGCFTVSGNENYYTIREKGIEMGCVTDYIPNNLNDLIREFQNWYWRDK